MNNIPLSEATIQSLAPYLPPSAMLPTPNWQLAPRPPLHRRGLCGLAQPCLKLPQHAPRFVFPEPTLQLIVSGQLELSTGHHEIQMRAATELLFIQPQTCADAYKQPGGEDDCYRSVFLTIAADLLDSLPRKQASQSEIMPLAPFGRVSLDKDLAGSLWHVLTGIEDPALSDERLRFRLLELLSALAERGCLFSRNSSPTTAARVRALIGDDPAKQWTAQTAGKALAMSPATLRRRLSEENARFEHLLIDVRMHHAMMLVQTTPWSLTRIAEACGYRSRARFSERFQERFGCLPSEVK